MASNRHRKRSGRQGGGKRETGAEAADEASEGAVPRHGDRMKLKQVRGSGGHAAHPGVLFAVAAVTVTAPRLALAPVGAGAAAAVALATRPPGRALAAPADPRR